MVMLSRRTLLAATAFAPLASSLAGCASAANTTRVAPPVPDAAGFWDWVPSQYDVDPEITNVENGNWGLMARPVLDAYMAHTERVNRDNSFFARREYGRIANGILDELRIRLGAQNNEVAFTRGATEALQNIIGGYNKLTSGDTVIMADLDYDSVMEAMRWRAQKSDCAVITLSIPENTDHDELITLYKLAFEANPKTKLLLLTHISHRTGLMMPVREITRIAHEHGIDVVVDAAHSWGQVDFRVTDLEADFIGFNLHKWMGAPIGVGAMYIRSDKLARIDKNLSEISGHDENIYSRVHTGTSNFAAFMTLPDAFAFQDQLALANKAKRLRSLRKIWVDQVRDVDGIDVLTPEDDRLHAGITSFRFTGMTSAESNRAIADYLYEKHRVFTVLRTGVAAGACVRITPGYYNTPEDMQTTAEAISDALRFFRT